MYDSRETFTISSIFFSFITSEQQRMYGLKVQSKTYVIIITF